MSIDNQEEWKPNTRSTFSTLGSTNHSKYDRANNDYYATDPKALELLMEEYKFSNNIWECACGEGHLSKVLVERGYNVTSTDLIDRGYGKGGVDFLKYEGTFSGDIITNPPYKYAKQFVEKAMEVVEEGNTVAMFLRTLFLEGQARKKMFAKYPPKTVLVSSSRIDCARNGDFGQKGAMSYSWFIWEKGYKGKTELRWFN